MPRGKYKSKVGTVISDKMDKTVVVDVIQIKKDPRYKKAVKRNTKFKAHDENEQCRVGGQGAHNRDQARQQDEEVAGQQDH